MAATTSQRATKFAGVVPSRGTYPMAANELIVGGTIVCVNASGQAVAGVDGEGFNAVGKASQDYDNRTTAPEGGGAGAIDAGVEYGLFGWAYTGTAPIAEDIVYVVDNQTVSLDSNGGTRGIAGVVTEVRDSMVYVWMGPHVSALTQGSGVVNVPLDSFRTAAGAAIAAFNDGAADGFVVSEGLMYRYNVSSTAPIWTTVAMPADLNPAVDVVVHMLASREGSADTDVVVTVAAFFQTVGAAYTADADAGGDTGALAAATTVVAELTLALAAADVPAAPCALSLSLVPDAALDADDLNIHAVWLEYARK